jgi:hypothetical protein
LAAFWIFALGISGGCKVGILIQKSLKVAPKGMEMLPKGRRTVFKGLWIAKDR